MIAQTKAELLKIRTTRTTIALILGMIALILIFTLLDGLLSHPSGLMGKENQRELLGVSSLTAVFAALAGVLLVTSEYRYGTIRPTVLFNPARSHVLSAKVIAGALAGLVFGVLGAAISSSTQSSMHAASRSSSTATMSCCSRSEGSPASRYGARSAPPSARSSTTKSAPSSPYSPGASSSTTSYSASRRPLDGSCRHTPRTR